jgi:hypothetical protein
VLLSLLNQSNRQGAEDEKAFVPCSYNDHRNSLDGRLPQGATKCFRGVPRCKVRPRYETIRYRSSFPCTECGKMLHIPAIYTVMPSYLVLAICAFLLFQFGFRDYILAIGALAAWFPALFLDAKFGRTFFPPVIRVEEDIDSRMTGLRL